LRFGTSKGGPYLKHVDSLRGTVISGFEPGPEEENPVRREEEEFRDAALV